MSCSFNHFAISIAFSCARSIRTPKVLIPLWIRKQSNGANPAPVVLIRKRNLSLISSLFVTKNPASVSLWPPRYFVPLCTTISAPRSNGFWKYGDKNVLSTIRRMLCFFVISANALISVTFIIGLVGVSI